MWKTLFSSEAVGRAVGSMLKAKISRFDIHSWSATLRLNPETYGLIASANLAKFDDALILVDETYSTTCQSELNARTPLTISYTIQPRAQISDLLVNDESSSVTSSGLRYPEVPRLHSSATAVNPDRLDESPKSASFHTLSVVEYRTVFRSSFNKGTYCCAALGPDVQHCSRE